LSKFLTHCVCAMHHLGVCAVNGRNGSTTINGCFTYKYDGDDVAGNKGHATRPVIVGLSADTVGSQFDVNSSLSATMSGRVSAVPTMSADKPYTILLAGVGCRSQCPTVSLKCRPILSACVRLRLLAACSTSEQCIVVAGQWCTETLLSVWSVTDGQSHNKRLHLVRTTSACLPEMQTAGYSKNH